MKSNSETEQALVNTCYIIDTIISSLTRMEEEYDVLKKGMKALKLSDSVYPANMDKV